MSNRINPWKLTGYKPGQNVICRVMAAEPGGYAVVTAKDNLPGFLPCDGRLKIGEEVLAQYVCAQGGRILLSSKMSSSQLASGSAYKGKPPAAVSWQEAIQTGDGGASLSQQSLQGHTAAMAEPEQAFQVWAQSQPVAPKTRRAIDLILPPLDNAGASDINMGEQDLLWLITDLEGGMRTGCIKAVSETRKSRSAALLYKGRVVGCIYGNRDISEPLATDGSLQMMLKDMTLPDTVVTMYSLPEDITLAMSALFLGYPVERSDDLDACSYMEYIMSWFAQKEQTACMAFSLPSVNETILTFIHQGQFCGCFHVESQTFSRDMNYVNEIVAKDGNARIEVSILPPELTSSSVRFGYSLSMSMPKL